jgi:hypothetical protein
MAAPVSTDVINSIINNRVIKDFYGYAQEIYVIIMKCIAVEKVKINMIKEIDNLLNLINSDSEIIKYTKIKCISGGEYVFYLIYDEKQYNELVNNFLVFEYI